MMIVPDYEIPTVARRIAGKCTMMALYARAGQASKVERNLVSVVSTIAMEQDGEPVALSGIWS